jgi:tripartite-type tricarboxylate transporter receptor subunit TctC
MNVRRRFAIAATAAVWGLLSLSAAHAQPWPAKPLRIVVPFGPGSGTDAGTRLLAQHLSTALGQQVVVENRPGANGSIAAQAVARSAPDGYTLLMGTNSTHGANPGLFRTLPYDPAKDFVPVTMVGTFPSMLVVHPSVPARTVAELRAHAKANPGALTYASGNASSLIMAERFKRDAGVDVLKVQYPSNPPGLLDVAGGRVSMMFPDVASALPQVRSGAVRALAVVSLGGRTSLAPDLPTMPEAGMPGFEFVGWIGLFAPAGTPQPVVDRIAAETAKVLAVPEVRQRLEAIGAEARTMGPAEFRAHVDGELQAVPKLLREIGVQPE